jgi:hypothetical protein
MPRTSRASDHTCQRDRSPARRRVLWLAALILVLAGALYVWSHRFGEPEDFGDMRKQFKYGSTGSDHPFTRGVPYWIWKALPVMFSPSDVLPEGFKPKNGKKGYAAFGFVTEHGMDRPIGFSKRNVFGMDFIGLNCAFCHVSTLRKRPDDKEPQIILGGTGNTVDIEQYFLFLFAAASDEKFTPDKVMEEVLRQNPDMNWVERFVYRHFLICAVRDYIIQLKQNFDFIDTRSPDRLPRFGPGRVDTWAAYKRLFVHPPQRDKVVGIADFPSIWNQKARDGMRLHWDGNTDVLEERNIISALGAVGSNIDYLDFPRLTRITQWTIGLLPPRYEDWASGSWVDGHWVEEGGQHIDWQLAERGKGIFQYRCAACHAVKGDRVGRVEQYEDLRTDPGRFTAFTHELADALNRLETDAWKLRHFQTQTGYANMLLDGVWLRAPYLHNGSVPNLRDLLTEPPKRHKRFCRGTDLYDAKNVGFDSEPAVENGVEICKESFLYDTSVCGNSNDGHPYGTDLHPKDKDALIEYLKTL